MSRHRAAPRHARPPRRRLARYALAAALVAGLTAGALSAAGGTAAPAASYGAIAALPPLPVRGSHDNARLAELKQSAALLRTRAIRRDAARTRARQLAAAAATAAPPPAPAPVPSGSPQQIASGMLASYGWDASQFSCLDALWTRESGWDVNATNPSSGAYGIPQALPGSKMATAGADWQTSAATQITWGLGYIRDTYGSPCGAWSREQSDGYYSAGARLLTASVTAPKRLRALRWAEHYKGCWYSWGGTGPCSRGFDCSGLVYAAYRHQGFAIPRTTYGMLGWRRLKRVARPRRGDLAFYGPGHVELVTRLWHVTFGAHDAGTRVGYIRWNRFWEPTAFYHVRGSG